MANKDMTPEEFFDELMSMLTSEEQKAALELLQSSSGQINTDYSELFYHYQCPDYKLLTKPLAPYLKPLWNKEEFDDMFKQELLVHCAFVSKEEMTQELRNLMYHVFVDFQEKGDVEYQCRVLGAFWLMERFELEDCLDVVLESLRQDIGFYETYYSYGFEDIPSILIYEFGKNRLDELFDFMKESGILPIAKVKVAKAVAHIVVETPGRRLEVINWFCKLLNYYLEIMDEDDMYHPIIIDTIARCLLDIRGVEALSILEQFYTRFQIPSFEAPDFETLKEEMPDSEIEGLEFSSIDEFLADYDAELYKDDDWDEEDDEEEDDDDCDFFFDPDGNQCLYIESDSVKKLCLRISLEGLNPLIWRTLEVPSNIRLERFADVILAAMGWDGYHLHQFIKGKSLFLPEKFRDDGMFLPIGFHEMDSNNISLGELLNRKGASLEFEYDFGDSWMHKIKVESREDYKKGETPSIKLLDGAYACPPEDCGGIYGYATMLEALKHPRSKAAREYKEWLDDDFDPNYFDLEERKRRLEFFVE